MVSRDWAEQHIHDRIVGSPCGFCPALNLGLRAISLSSSYTTPDEEKGSPRTIGESPHSTIIVTGLSNRQGRVNGDRQSYRPY